MKRWQLGAIFFLLAVFGGGMKPVSAETHDIFTPLYLTHNQAERLYFLHKPANLKPGAPLVVVLHGMGGKAERMRHGTNLNSLADQYGFGVVYPQGADLRPTTSYWNAAFSDSGVDDVAFLSELVAQLEHDHGFAPDRTYAFGISNGGYMAYDMACRASGVFEGVAVIAASMSATDWAECQPRRPTPVLHIHGTQDHLVPWKGQDHWFGEGATPAIPDLVQFWVKVNGAEIVTVDQTIHNIRWYRYSNDRQKNLVWFLEMQGFGHDLPNRSNSQIRATEVAWRFFEVAGK